VRANGTHCGLGGALGKQLALFADHAPPSSPAEPLSRARAHGLAPSMPRDRPKRFSLKIAPPMMPNGV
jgi:hypothetical protein